MKFLELSVVLCVVSSAQCYKEFGITTPEELRSESNTRIIEGSPAGDNWYSHQGYLIITQGGGGLVSCGASLIGRRWAITSGHCLHGATSAQLHLGSVNINNSPVVVTSTNFHVHPDYNLGNLNHDLALLGLDADVPLGPNIIPIRIAEENSGTFEGQRVTTSGFGYVSDDGPPSSTLNYVDMSVISNVKCFNYYGNIVIDSTICCVGIRSPAQGVCSGDSGSPLIIGSGGPAEGHRLVGVVSFVSLGGCSYDAPSGFVRPYHYLNWIQGITGISRELLI